MACNPEVLKQVPLFALLDEEELPVLAGQIGLTSFAARQRIYKAGDPGGRAQGTAARAGPEDLGLGTGARNRSSDATQVACGCGRATPSASDRACLAHWLIDGR